AFLVDQRHEHLGGAVRSAVRQWWTFDDPWSIGKKTEYIKAKNLLGAMVWEMSGDDGSLTTALNNGLR
ncbi:glycosyl hydrolase family 18 protein, partial [Nonomuraea sp. NPDC055795]